MELGSSAKDLFGSEPSKFSVPFCNTKERNKLTWNTTRDFSNKYVLMLAPMIWNDVLKSISIYLPNLDELSFRVVFAFPMASMIGDEARTRFSIWVSVWEVPPTVAKYLMAYLALTVLPAPDSPDTMMDWSRLSLKKVKIQWGPENCCMILAFYMCRMALKIDHDQKETKCLAGIQTQAASKNNSHFH